MPILNKNKKTTVLLLFLFGLTLIAGSSFAAKASSLTPPDSKIRAAIESDLFVDEFIPSNLINVHVSDGIVTLTGNLGNILAAERTVRIAESIRGVKSVIDKIDILPVFRTDKKIRRDAVTALLNNPAISLYNIGVAVKDGEVSSSGTVDTWAEKRIAGESLMAVKGIKNVSNNIGIQKDQKRSDGEIRAEIIKLLKYSPYLYDENIDVTVRDNLVKLSGTVGSARESSMIETKAYVKGVKGVDNDLKVSWLSKDSMKRKKVDTAFVKDDNLLRNAVLETFLLDPRINTTKIEVKIHNGEALLKGRVDNLLIKRSAEEDALNTVGIWRVKNHIKVRPGKETNNVTIAEDTSSAFASNPFLDKQKVNIVVSNNKVYLYGNAGSIYEKELFEQTAAGVPGVVDIENNIKVKRDWSYKDDRALREDIKDQLYWNFLVNEDNIKVDVLGGIATLSGKVSNGLEYRAAVRNAFEGGAKQVRDKLIIAGNGYYPSGNLYEHYPPGLYFWLP
jgi:osmotically-inducible protein OsmY